MSTNKEKELLKALIVLREVASLVPDKVWANASDTYNLRRPDWNVETAADDYIFSFDLTRAAIEKAERGEK